MSFLDFSTVFTKMASDPKYPKLAEDISPSVQISEVLDTIKDLYFGAGYCSILNNKLDYVCNRVDFQVSCFHFTIFLEKKNSAI